MEPIPVRCRIPDLLRSLGKDQQWLANQTGYSKQRISDYVHLRYTMRLPAATLIAKWLRVHADELHEWDWQQE